MIETRIGLALAVTLSLCYLAHRSYAADIRFGGVVPGVGIIRKPVVSMREARFRDMVRQETDFSCGAAALATILKYAYGREANEHEVIRGLLRVSDAHIVREKGFSLLDIKRYVQTLGMRAHGYRIDEQALSKIKIPVIVLLDMKGYKHFVVFKKAAADKVYIADPSLGNKVMAMQEFVSGWNKIAFAVIGKRFERETVLLQPREPLTAKRLLAVFAPVTSAQLLDFGFTHAELF